MAHGAYAKRRVASRLGGAYAARSSPRGIGLRSKEWDKKAIRNQIRYIERLLKRALPLEIKTAHEKHLEDLKWQAELHLHRKMALRDRKLKFFERRKLERRIRRLEKRHRLNSEQHPHQQQANDTTRQLDQLKEDLEYVRFFPKSERYVSVFAGSDDDMTRCRRSEIRDKIKAWRATAAAAGNELETGSEDDEPMDLSEDDAFAEGTSSEDADADDEWTDRSERPGEDKEETSRDTGPSPIPLDEPPQSREVQEDSARLLMPPPRCNSIGVQSRNRLSSRGGQQHRGYMYSSTSEDAVPSSSSSGGGPLRSSSSSSSKAADSSSSCS